MHSGLIKLSRKKLVRREDNPRFVIQLQKNMTLLLDLLQTQSFGQEYSNITSIVEHYMIVHVMYKCVLVTHNACV